MSLSPETIAIIKSTAPALQQHGLAITIRMYERLFQDSALKTLFDEAAQITGYQPQRLAGAILAFARNVDNVPALSGAIEAIATRHVSTHIKAEHYPAVAAALLPAMQDVLGSAATPEIIDAWGQAYWFLANILITRETQLYAATA